jgi:hypothetical protein
MAVTNRNSLVLNSVSVVRGVVTGTVGMGFASASNKTAAIPFSMRLLSHTYPQTGQDTSWRQGHDAARRGTDPGAERAGRPERRGVPASRSFALFLATGGACPTAAWQFGPLMAKQPASVGNVPLGASLAGSKPAGEALPTSARGVGF